MIEYILLPETIDAVGWTLIHSLWQGAIFAFLLVLTLIALRGYTSQSRYIVSVGLLSAFFLTTSVTFYQQWQEANSHYTMLSAQSNIELLGNDLTRSNDASANVITPVILEKTQSISSDLVIVEGYSWISSFSNYFNTHLPLLVTIWFLGVLFLQLRFLGRLAYVQRLKHYGTQLFPTSWNDKLEELEGKLRIQKQIVYRMSNRIQSPMVIGWLKPFVLVPQQIFSSLTETEIYAVLAHELAHIRREDFIINLLQTFLCNIFFFHPGIWWMSNQVDEEREHCCDDLAVAALGGPVNYAKTLINVSELQLNLQANTQLAMSLSGKSKRKKSGFSDRIHRLFNVKEGRGTVKEKFATILILLSAVMLGIAATESTFDENIESEQDAIEVENTITTSSQVYEINPLALGENDPNQDSNQDSKEIPVCGPAPEVEPRQLLSIDQLPIAQPAPSAKPVPAVRAAPAVQPASTRYTLKDEKYDDTRIDALIMACMEGDLEFVQTLVEAGININGIGTEGFTPLMVAASNQESKIVKYLIEQGADVNATTNGWNALIEAADEGSLKSMKFLLEAGADVNYFWTPGSPTAITMAASENYLECLELLIEYGADINGVGSSMPPLHIAAEEGNLKIIDYLITRNVDIHKKDLFGRTALMYAAEEGNTRSFERLMNAGANIDTKDNEGYTAKDFAWEEGEHGIFKAYNNLDNIDIHQATREGLIEIVEEMVEQGYNVNAQDDDGRTPLHIAAALNHNIDMRVLIGLGADINAQDKQGRTPMMYAAADGKSDAVVLLVSELADVDIQDVEGMTAYAWSQSGSNSDLVNFLGLITSVENDGKEKSKTLKYREEQKIVAKEVQRQIEKVVEKITDNFGENEHSSNDKSRETFHINGNSQHLKQYNIKEENSELFDVVRSGTLQDLENILAVELDLNASDETGQTALMIAVRGNRLDIAKKLIINGADVNQSSFSGLTALHYAALENYGRMAKLLLENGANVDPTMKYSSTDGNYTNEALVYQYIGATPLLIATESSNREVVAILLEAGANPNQILTKKEYRLHKDRKTYLDASEVMGIDEDFLKHVDVKVTDDTWTPFEQAQLLNKSEILALYHK